MSNTAATYEKPVPVLGRVAIILIAIFALLAIVFGVLWGMLFFGPDYQKQAQTLQVKLNGTEEEAVQLRQISGALQEQLGQPIAYGFEVQIGAFEHFDISAQAEDLVRMSKLDQGGMNKYVLGRFTDLQSAKDFLADVRTMGVSDAFIAGVVDGKRATVKEAQAAAQEFYGR